MTSTKNKHFIATTVSSLLISVKQLISNSKLHVRTRSTKQPVGPAESPSITTLKAH